MELKDVHIPKLSIAAYLLNNASAGNTDSETDYIKIEAQSTDGTARHKLRKIVVAVEAYDTLNMLVETTVQEKKTVTITEPSFYKSPNSGLDIEMIAVLDKNTAISIYRMFGLTIVQNGTTNVLGSSIVKAVEKWEPATEEEFMAAYNATLLSLSLEPKEVSAADKNDIKQINFR
jgi:hypothetical protein